MDRAYTCSSTLYCHLCKRKTRQKNYSRPNACAYRACQRAPACVYTHLLTCTRTHTRTLCHARTQRNEARDLVFLDEIQGISNDIHSMSLRIVFRVRVSEDREGVRLTGILPTWVTSRRLLDKFFENELVFSRSVQSISLSIFHALTASSHR